jgi:hypothetical protein
MFLSFQILQTVYMKIYSGFFQAEVSLVSMNRLMQAANYIVKIIHIISLKKWEINKNEHMPTKLKQD